MRLYDVSVRFVIRSSDSSQSYDLEVYRYANSAASAMATVSSLVGSMSNFAWASGTYAGKKQVEVTLLSAVEIEE